MATRKRAVSRSIITTRSSSSSKTKLKPERHEHQPSQPTTASTQASPTITITSITHQNQQCSPLPLEKDQNSCKAEEVCCSLSTPKAKRFRIPEIEICPPAPKKQRTSSSSTNGGSNCFLRRSPMSFFSPPELAEFFLNVSPVPNMSSTIA